jgi:hypothetical protein
MDCSHLDRQFFLVLRKRLTKTQFENFVLLMLAKTLGRSFILWQLAVSVTLPISVEAAYQRLKRLLAGEPPMEELQQAWVQIVTEYFPHHQHAKILIDWTMHTDRFRTLWVQLAVGMGRSIPLCFWMHSNEFDGKGSQRAFEDDALRQLHSWLPQGYPVLLIGDRGFGGRDRMRFLENELNWKFVLRVAGDAQIRTLVRERGQRGWRWHAHWQRVDENPPQPGQSWSLRQAHYGKGKSIVVNLFATRSAVARRGQDSSVWYLASNCDLSDPVILWYGQRMQIEESFRDMKAEFGLEKEQTRDPVKRLRWQMLALMVILARQMLLGEEVLSQREGPSEAASGDPQTPSGFGAEGRYRTVSVLRRGWHAVLCELITNGESEMGRLVREISAKCRRLQERPQTKSRRKRVPTRQRQKKAEATT